MTTQFTAGGVTLAGAAIGGGPKININQFKIGPTITPPPVANDPATDIVGSVYTGDASHLQYAIIDNNTVEYIVTLTESIGDFAVGHIGLYHDNGDGTHTLFSLTALDQPNPDYKFATSGNRVGDRLTYAIYLSISNLSKIANFTIPLLPLVSVPEAPQETDLIDPLHVVFNTSQVVKHSVTHVPVLAYRETASQGSPFPAWFMTPERTIPGRGEGIIPLDQSLFDSTALVGTVVGLDSTNGKVTIGEPATNQYIVGVRSSAEEITNYGIYVDPVNTYSPMQKLYAGTGTNAGRLTTISNNWPIGYALGPASTTNATGYLCWIDFTFGYFGTDTIGRPGPAGPPGPQGPSGSGGPSGGGIFTPGAYLKKIGTNLVLIPYNGNLIVINQAVQKIPAGGVALAPTGLNPTTLYYIYAYMNGATMMLEASVTNHVTSTIDGVEIKIGDQTRSLVGMAYTIPGPAWADVAPSTQATGNNGEVANSYNVGLLYVLSWFNPRPKSNVTWVIAPQGTGHLANWKAGASLTSSTLVEISGTLRNSFLTWAGREVFYSTSGQAAVISPRGSAAAMQFDGVGYEKYGTGVHQQSLSGMALNMQPGVQGIKQGLSEGLHFGTLLGAVLGGTGTATWRTGIGGNGPIMDAPVSLEITVCG